MNTGSSFFTATDEFTDEIFAFAVKHVNQVATVVDNQVRFNFESFAEIYVVFFASATVSCKYGDTAIYKSSSNIILGRKRVTTSYNYISTCIFQNLCQISSFSFQVNGNNHVQTFEDLFFAIFFVEQVQKGHILFYPRNFLFTGRCQVNVFNHAFQGL